MILIADIKCILSFFFRTTAAMFLEKQTKKVDNMVTGFEDKLSVDAVIVDEPNNINSHSKKLKVKCFSCIIHWIKKLWEMIMHDMTLM